jgi:hypothetical protein
MRRILPLITTLALLLSVSAYANDSVAEPISLGLTLSCGAGGAGFHPDRVACFLERRILTLGDLEVGIGLDASLRFPRETRGVHPDIGVFGTIAYYRPTWSTFLEVMTPSLVSRFLPTDPARPPGVRWRVGFVVRP